MAVIPAIPASEIVSVTPSVLSAGGTGLDIIGLILTQNTRVPSGTVLNFPTAAAVTAYFGGGTNESALGTIYFLGSDNSNKKPGNLLFAQYNTASISAVLRGDTLGLTLTQLQAITGTLQITIDGVLRSGTLTFATITSFSNGAQLIGNTLGIGTASVSYDATTGNFVVTSLTTGTVSTITYGTGTAANSLQLSQAAGAIIAQGAAANAPNTGAPNTFMNNLVLITQNWVTFMTVWEPTDQDKISFATWNNGQNNRYAYAMWDTSAINIGPVGPDVPVAAINNGNFSGTMMLYSNPAVDTLGGEIAAFWMGQVASIDFNETNGRTTSAFRSQTGLLPQVSGATVYNNLINYGLNLYGNFTTANDSFTFLYPGSISGPFTWADSYINQIWLNSQLQLALIELLINAKSIPYSAAGYALVEAALLDPVLAAVTFGAIVPGVTLSNAQQAEVNASAGINIATILQQRGWYIQVQDALPSVRMLRQSPPATLWYTDGESIQQINLASIDIL